VNNSYWRGSSGGGGGRDGCDTDDIIFLKPNK